MQITDRLGHMWRLKPIASGEKSPALSLTAEEGTWIKIRDFKSHLNVVLVFFRSLRDDATDGMLRELDKLVPVFEQLDTIVFGVTQHRTDDLRDFRARLGLDYHLVYDPMALTARKFGCSGRVRPYCRPSTVVVDKQGKVAATSCGWMPTDDLLKVLADLQRTEVPDLEAARAYTGVRDPGAPADEAKPISSDEAKDLLSEKDSVFILLDVRSAAEHAAFQPEGALNIPLDELPHRYQELPQTTDIICISQTGGQSATAAEFLTSIGMSNVYTVTDGMASWPGAPA